MCIVLMQHDQWTSLFTFCFQSRLVGIDSLLTLLHAYSLRLIKSILVWSLFKLLSDDNAIQMYLKQMIHSMSSTQSCHADHLPKNKGGGYSLKQQVEPDKCTEQQVLQTRQSKSSPQRQKDKVTLQEQSASQIIARTDRQTKTDRLKQQQEAKQTGRSVSSSSSRQGRLAERGLAGQGTHLDCT